MDTTAAAELGLAVIGPGVDGVGFWDGGSPDHNRRPPESSDYVSNSRKFEAGAWEKGTDRRSFGRHSRPASSGPEPPHKRPRIVPAETSGEGNGYGERYDGGYGEGSEGIAYGDSENGAASRMNSGFGSVSADGALAGQGETMRTSNFSGDFGADARPQTPSSSGASGSPFTVRGRGTGSIFFKTKLCTKFRAGTCPYNSNCNFAHGMEELRKPPPGWEDIVAVQDAERGLRNREPSGQPILSNTVSGNSSDFQRLHKTRPCKKYYSEEGCPYGDRCNFLHDDQAGARESNAISLGPSGSPSRGAGGGGGGGNGNERPPNWKTRMCNKWETTGHCPFGQKCHFAHGLVELQTYGGAQVDSDNGATSGGGQRSDAKQGGPASFKTFPDVGSSHVSTMYGTDGHASATISRYGGGVLVSMQIQKQAVKSMPKWKGPADEISTIYGDWIEEDEWERPFLSLKPGTEQSTEKNIQLQQFKEQSLQQLAVPFKGNVMIGVSGQRQDGLNIYSKTSKNEHGPMHVVYGNLTLSGDGGVDGEEL